MILALAACTPGDGPLAELGEKIDDARAFASPVVAGAIVLGIDEPEIRGAGEVLRSQGLSPGTLVEVFLGSASGDLLEDVGLRGDVIVVDAGFDPFPVPRLEPGSHVLLPDERGPEYQPGQVWRIFADTADGSGAIAFGLPPAVKGELAPARGGLTLDVGGQGFHSSLLVVANLDYGVLTWADVPATLEDALDLLLIRDDLGRIDVPADAFPAPGRYVVGIAGLRHSKDASLEGLNPILSRATAGKMRLFEVEAR